MAPHATSEDISSLYEASRSNPSANIGGHRSLPVSDPCLSFWHRTTRAWPYLHHNENEPVPTATKYLIIGSGLSGCLTAWSLVESGVLSSDILILEAREAVSGASGRNAGHVRPDAFRGFAAYAKIHGDEQARKIIENERLVFEKLDAFVRAHKVPCDFQSTTTFDVCLTDDFAAYQKESLARYRAAGGDVSHVKYFEGAEAQSRTRVDSAVAAYEWPAGSSHPAKLAQWMLSQLLSNGVKLWTHCPGLDITQHTSSNAGDAARWDVTTPNGVIAAQVIVHCTNAYTAQLLPELASFVKPNRAQAHSFIPMKSLSGGSALTSTMSLRYSLRHFYSLIQRSGDGTVIFGVSRDNPEWSSATKDSIVTFDDAMYNQEVAMSAKHAFQELFDQADSKGRRHGEGADHFWSGIIAMTPDSVPMVGPIDGKEGQFICAGHNGHGTYIETCKAYKYCLSDAIVVVGSAFPISRHVLTFIFFRL